MDNLQDYNEHTLAVGDTIRSIENGWRGVIQAIGDDEGRNTMLECLGVNFWTGELDEDDRQWYSAYDVVFQPRQEHRNGDPINAINMM